MRNVYSLQDRRGDQQVNELRERFLRLAGETFDFVLSASSAIAQMQRPSPTSSVARPPYKVPEAARILGLSVTSLRDRVRDGKYDHALIKGELPIRFYADVIDAMATKS